MFTGLIEEIGTVRRIERGAKGARLTIAAEYRARKYKNRRQHCHERRMPDRGRADGRQLQRRRNGGEPAAFRARQSAERLAGQSGARDACRRTVRRVISYPATSTGTGSVLSQRREDNAVWVTIKTPSPLLRYIVEKGSIAIDGVSLTVAAVTDTDFSVSIIPHTGAQTILLGKKPGEPVNLECDVIGKYVEKMLTPHKSSGITMDFLAQHGF